MKNEESWIDLPSNPASLLEQGVPLGGGRELKPTMGGAKQPF
jgi:hypothetical protein